MENKKQIPIGIDDFKTLIESCYYVDKTLLIKDIIESPTSTVFLFTRPRRFGKSLSLSMLEEFFDNKEKEKNIFENLNIWKDNDSHNYYGSSIVLRLNFKTIEASNYDDMIKQFRYRIKELYENNYNHLDFSKLNEFEKKYIENIIELKEEDLSASLRKLTNYIEKSSSIKPMILIDEYDSPIHIAIKNGFYDGIIMFIRSFLGDALKSNPSLGKAILTGITRVAKESLFSGLNNFNVSSVFSYYFSEYWGFKKEEVVELLKYYNKECELDYITKMYDGYKFGNENVYNPWSVLNYIKYPLNDRLYWSNTSGLYELGELIFNSSEKTIEKLKSLYENGKIEANVDEGISYLDYKINNEAIFTLLVNLGYLTVEKNIYASIYELRFPNCEIRELFEKQIFSRFIKSNEQINLFKLKEAFLSEDIKEIEKIITNKILAVFSAYDYSNPRAMQVASLVISTILFGEKKVKSEVNSGEGRCDIVIYPDNVNNIGILVEVKSTNSKLSQQQMEARANVALKQIIQKDYAKELKILKPNKIYAYGFSYSKNKLVVKSLDLTKEN